jgi:hypothetical protein
MVSQKEFRLSKKFIKEIGVELVIDAMKPLVMDFTIKKRKH